MYYAARSYYQDLRQKREELVAQLVALAKSLLKQNKLDYSAAKFGATIEKTLAEIGFR